jgi:peroxiredoxin Q/BCP
MNMKRIVLAGLAVGVASSLLAAVSVGEQAPTFSAKDQDGKEWTLSNHLDKPYLVVYFYPAAMTGGCTKQACSYRDFKMQNSDLDIEVVGISGDPVQNLAYFKQAEQLNFTLLSDPDGAIAKAFGVPVSAGEKSITRTVDGKEVELIRENTASRWTFVIDREGKIVYRDDQVKPTEDLENILAFIRNSTGG